jgi:hypothetical protein
VLFHELADLGRHLALAQQGELKRSRVGHQALLLGRDTVGGVASQGKLALLVPTNPAGRCGCLTDPVFVHPNDPQTQRAAQANKMNIA